VFAFGQGKGSAIYVFDFAASRRTLLAAGASAPAWSPDGSTIAYRGDCGVKLVTPGGWDVTPISGPFRCQGIGVRGIPVWSPDGEKIAIGTRSRGIYLVKADGTHLSRITKEGAAGATGLGRPSWRSDVTWDDAVDPAPRKK